MPVSRHGSKGRVTVPGSLSRRTGIGLAAWLALVGAAAAQAISEPDSGAATSGTLDCTEVSVDYTADPDATRGERIAAMDRALFRSLSKYDACQAARTGAAGGGAAGGSGAAGIQGGGSVAATDMSGEGASALRPARDGQGTDWSVPPEEAGEPATGDPAAPQQAATSALANGKAPEDIPPADNDSVLEAQIRQAAMNETDPETRAKLWNEYRKYKGLPPVN